MNALIRLAPIASYCMIAAALGVPLSAQNLPDAPSASAEKAVPVITGFFSYQSNFGHNEFDTGPEFDPVLLLPLGDKLLVQSEFDMALDVERDGSHWGPAVVAHGFDYLQADYILHPHLTLVGGYYMIPFGIYRERMHPLWIRYLQVEPISFTLNATSGNGAMLRGGAHLTSSTEVTYTAYYSAASTLALMPSDKQVGSRASIVLQDRRMEIGSSYNRTEGSGAHNMFGTDFTWNLKRLPLDVRSETLFSKQAGNTYWVEGAYRLNKLAPVSLLRYSYLVFRQEQYWMPSSTTAVAMMGGTMGSLPDTNTTRSTIGTDISITPNLRINSAYQGNYATGEHSHSWNLGMTYRFAIP